MQVYYDILERVKEGVVDQYKTLITTTDGDDGQILTKIVETVFVPTSEAFPRQMSGDTCQYAACDHD